MIKTRAILKDERAATAIEYGLVAALIAMAIITTITAVADQTIGMWDHVSNTIDVAIK